MRKLYSLLILAFFTFDAATAHAVTTSCATDKHEVYCELLEVMESYVSSIACDQRIDGTDSLCSGSQEPSSGFHDVGQFGLALNQRNQEAVYTLAFLYQNSYSSYYQNSALLNRVVWALDYLRRAQGAEGGISENGWKGIDYDDNNNNLNYNERGTHSGSATSVAGFTYYAAGRAISILSGITAFENKLDENTAIGGDGVSNDLRRKAYANLVAKGAKFLSTTLNGRGKSPNQAVWSLLALYALDDAYTDLDYAVSDSELVTIMDELVDSKVESIADRIFGGEIYHEDPNYFDTWFSDDGMLLEPGFKASSVAKADSLSVGYDSSYSNVTLRGLVMLNVMDSGNFPLTSGVVNDYIEAIRLFLYLDLDLEKGGYQVSNVSRRKPQEHSVPFVPAGIGQSHPSLKAIFNAGLEHFMHDPDDFFEISNKFRGKLYAIGDLLRNWQDPSTTTHTLPLNTASTIARSGETLYNTSSTGAYDVHASFRLYNSNGTLAGITYVTENWWDGTKFYQYGASTAIITNLTLSETGCSDSSGGNSSSTIAAINNLGLCQDAYNLYGRRTSGSSDTQAVSCYNGDGVLKEIFVCNSSGDDYIVQALTSPESSSFDVDFDNDGDGNYLDTDDDNDGLSDIQESSLGSDPFDTDSDDDGLDDYTEYTNGTDPTDSDTDGDGIPDGEDSDNNTHAGVAGFLPVMYHLILN